MSDKEMEEAILKEIERVCGKDHNFVVSVVNGEAVVSEHGDE